jgi:hypothetical protein
MMMMQMRVYMIRALVWAEAPKWSDLRTTSVICTLVTENSVSHGVSFATLGRENQFQRARKICGFI